MRLNQSPDRLAPDRFPVDLLIPLRASGTPMRSVVTARIFLLLLVLLGPVHAIAGSVTLAWDPVNSPLLAGYRLHYGPSAGSYTTTIDVGNTTVRTVANLVDGATYHFAVTSYSSSGLSSGFSNDVAATVAPVSPTDTSAPTAPAGLVVRANGAGGIDLNWNASTDNVGVARYLVERCQGVGCTWFAQIASPMGTSISDTFFYESGLPPGTPYFYRVRATDVAGNLSPYSNVASAAVTGAAGAANFTGLWWAAPAASEDGWGVNIAHQGDTMFVTWFTYDANRKGWWLVMVASKTAEGVYSGTLLATRGPAFHSVPFNANGNGITVTPVGSGTLNYTAASGPTFTYTVNGTTRSKPITRQLLNAAPVPACSFGVANASAATNYTDLWWASPARSEDGWGINLTHQGDTIFATWFTYDVDGTPMWLVATAQKTAPGVYSGRLLRTTGTPYNATSYSGFSKTDVGNLTFSFANGNSAVMSYTIAGIAPITVTQTKSIIREVLSDPGTVCQ